MRRGRAGVRGRPYPPGISPSTTPQVAHTLAAASGSAFAVAASAFSACTPTRQATGNYRQPMAHPKYDDLHGRDPIFWAYGVHKGIREVPVGGRWVTHEGEGGGGRGREESPARHAAAAAGGGPTGFAPHASLPREEQGAPQPVVHRRFGGRPSWV